MCLAREAQREDTKHEGSRETRKSVLLAAHHASLVSKALECRFLLGMTPCVSTLSLDKLIHCRRCRLSTSRRCTKTRRLQKTHLALISLTFNKDKPKDVDDVLIGDAHAVPVAMAAKMGRLTMPAHAPRSMASEYMVVMMANEDFWAMAVEMHYPESSVPYTFGKKKKDENWGTYAMMQRAICTIACQVSDGP